MAWYGLAYSRIYEVTKLRKFLDISTKIFDWVWANGWDSQAENSTPVRDEV